MSEPNPGDAQPDAEGSPEPKGSAGPARKYLLAAAGLVAGGLVGSFALAPALAPGKSEAAAHAAPKSGSHGPAAATGAVSQPHLMDNLVVNPADSRGTRFLLLSVGIIMTNAEADDEVRRRDAETRDRVVQVLGGKTVDELVDITRRDAIRRDVAASIDSLIGSGKVRSVLFPQFVIQ